MVNVSEEEGVIENKEKEMITNVVDFGDSRVRDIMIPRTDVTMVPVTATYDEYKWGKDIYQKLYDVHIKY